MTKKKKQSNLNEKVEEVAEKIKEVVKEVPEKEVVKEIPIDSKYKCPRCGALMVVTGGGPSGSDLHCDKCGLNNTKVI